MKPNTDSQDELEQGIRYILQKVDRMKTNEHDGNPFLPGGLSEDEAFYGVMNFINAHTQKLVGRAKLEVIENVKAWADDVEVTYNRMIETELDSLPRLTKDKEGKK